MTNKIFKALITGAFLALGTAPASFSAECIAPANPGGGWDFTCRSPRLSYLIVPFLKESSWKRKKA